MIHTGARFAKWGMLPLRIVVGLVFLMHGGQKLFIFGIGVWSAGLCLFLRGPRPPVARPRCRPPLIQLELLLPVEGETRAR